MKPIKTIILWVVALQIFNMSICSEAYWFDFSENQSGHFTDKQLDPTETIVEWLVELKLGQQDAFTYEHNNMDSKNLVKTFAFHIDLENQVSRIEFIGNQSRIVFPYNTSKLQYPSYEILSPPPDQVA